ncbi:MAG TPA: diguanylate cyclase [Acidobacteriaceae bacterium]|nr:diguanylate cyclase [Acidobacteriaceae bacterium]
MAVDDLDFQFIANHTGDVICRIGTDMTLLYVSPSASRVLGWNQEEMRGQVLEDFVPAKDVSALTSNLNSDLDESFVTLRMRRKDGTLAWVEMTHRILRHAATGNPAETIIVIRDITERKTLEERLSVLELTDPRTGLSTPRAFDDALEREWNRSIREGSDISLLLLDFDRFRNFHDLHREGDSCLAKAAAAVIGAVRVTDFTAHYGIEDIAILLPSTGPGSAAKVAEKVRSAVHTLRSSPESIGLREGRMSVNIGMASVSPRVGATPRMPEILRVGADQVLRKARDQRMLWRNAPQAMPPQDRYF